MMERHPVAEPDATSAGAERLADLLMMSYEPMLAWRLDGPIELWNAGAERLYGFASNEAVGHSSHALANQVPDRIYSTTFKASDRTLGKPTRRLLSG
jgi:PAS domain-containing protein